LSKLARILPDILAVLKPASSTGHKPCQSRGFWPVTIVFGFIFLANNYSFRCLTQSATILIFYHNDNQRVGHDKQTGSGTSLLGVQGPRVFAPTNLTSQAGSHHPCPGLPKTVRFFIVVSHRKPKTLQTMSLSPAAAADPPPQKDRRGMDLLPQFKDQVSPVAPGPRPQKDRRGSDPPPQFKNHQVGRMAEEVPLAEATPVVADSFSPRRLTPSRIEERLLRLEQQQQGGRRTPAPSTTTGSTAKCYFSSKQKLWIALGSVLVVVVAAVAVVIAMVAGGGDPETPTPPPPARVESILSYITSITLSNQTLSYPPSSSTDNTAEERAVQWLIEIDLTTTTADSDALRQRFALSTLWFIPTPAGFGTDDDGNHHVETWATEVDECAWLGVRCTGDGRVTALLLSEQNVRGRIPDDLGLLTAMTSLDLWGNQITGTIPSSLAAMTDLVKLGLDSNRLTGTIPSSLAAMTDLTEMRLDNNLLTGTIPTSLGLLTAMTRLELFSNRMMGPIPSSLGDLTALVILGLGNNFLTGTIPSSLGQLTAMTSLQLWNNTLNGTIQSSLAAMTNLVALGLSTNILTGTIPSSLGLLTALTGLWLHNNQLNGTLPLCDFNPTFENLVADCAEVSCTCCTHCCPTDSENGTIPVYGYC
jgi:Leucine rich repeat